MHLRSQVFQAFVLRVHINLPRCCLGRCASCLRRTFGRRGVLFVGSVRFTLTTCTCCGSRKRRCCKCNLVQAELSARNCIQHMWELNIQGFAAKDLFIIYICNETPHSRFVWDGGAGATASAQPSTRPSPKAGSGCGLQLLGSLCFGASTFGALCFGLQFLGALPFWTSTFCHTLFLNFNF